MVVLMIIVQTQALEMNANPRKITFFVEKVPHVFLRVRIPLLFFYAQNNTLQLVCVLALKSSLIGTFLSKPACSMSAF